MVTRWRFLRGFLSYYYWIVLDRTVCRITGHRACTLACGIDYAAINRLHCSRCHATWRAEL